MTTTDPTDARASAWICAFDTIRAAQKLKLNKHKRAVEQLPELYWSLMAEAAIFADLGRAILRFSSTPKSFKESTQRANLIDVVGKLRPGRLAVSPQCIATTDVSSNMGEPESPGASARSCRM